MYPVALNKYRLTCDKCGVVKIELEATSERGAIRHARQSHGWGWEAWKQDGHKVEGDVCPRCLEKSE